VEDEAGLVVTLSDRLRNEGYWVEVARDGRQGLDRSLNDPFDLIVLDVMLPQKSGIDVCRDLRQNGLAVPILMLTARSQTVDKVLGLKIGADDYVTKPFDMLELLARVEALLRRAPSTPASLGAVPVAALLHRAPRRYAVSQRTARASVGVRLDNSDTHR
jgi:two-component system alkaline phosphatase synthesis response regulator PhoP